MEYVKLKDKDVLEITGFQELSFIKWVDKKPVRSDTQKDASYKAQYCWEAGKEAVNMTQEEHGKLLIAAFDAKTGKSDAVGKKFIVKHVSKHVKFSDGEKDIIENFISADKEQVSTSDLPL